MASLNRVISATDSVQTAHDAAFHQCGDHSASSSVPRQTSENSLSYVEDTSPHDCCPLNVHNNRYYAPENTNPASLAHRQISQISIVSITSSSRSHDNHESYIIESADDVIEDDSDDSEEDSELDDAEMELAEARQKDMRKQIVSIQKDLTLSETEQSKRIQALMSKKWTEKLQNDRLSDSRLINKLTDKKSNFSNVTSEDKLPTHQSEGVLGCRHYKRACKLQAHCCGKWDTCRFCHDEVSDHNITRNLIETMMCMYCSLVQPAAQDCINDACKKRVSAYYCKECKLWDNDPKKTIYHCHDCGICRIGKGLGIDYFHCQTCNVCMAIGLKGRHKCIERNLESDCPICGEFMFTSTSTVIFMVHCT